MNTVNIFRKEESKMFLLSNFCINLKKLATEVFSMLVSVLSSNLPTRPGQINQFCQ